MEPAVAPSDDGAAAFAVFATIERCLARPAEAREASEGWRPGLDLNQDKGRCTALALTRSATGPLRSLPIGGGAGYLDLPLTLTAGRSRADQRVVGDEGHAPRVVADILAGACGGKSGPGQLLDDLGLAVTLQAHARAQLPIIGQRGCGEPPERVLQEAVLRRKA